MTKTWIIATIVLALAGTLAPDLSQAKRLGGGKSTGMQRSMPARTAPDAAPAKPTTPPQQAAPANATPSPAATPAPTAAPVAPKRNWLGPLAGLAAGLGLAALASHFGFGEGLANVMMVALLVMAAVALFAFLRRRLAGPTLAPAGAGGMARSAPADVAWPGAGSTAPATEAQPVPAATASTAPASSAAEAVTPAAAAEAPAAAALPRAFVPAAFDNEAFERTARLIFIRMQAAHDAANLDELRQFTTPEMLAGVRLDLLDRGPAGQTTDVRRIDATVLDVAEEAERQVVSVRFRGEVVEAAGEAPQPVDEVWHFVKARSGDEAWRIAGIEQMS